MLLCLVKTPLGFARRFKCFLSKRDRSLTYFFWENLLRLLYPPRKKPAHMFTALFVAICSLLLLIQMKIALYMHCLSLLKNKFFFYRIIYRI